MNRPIVFRLLSRLEMPPCLAPTLGVSQARLNAGRRLSPAWPARVWSVVCVWGFVVCLQVFADESRSFAFADRIAFFFSLFGVS